MAKMLQDGLLDDIDPWYWAYVGGFSFMMLVGSCVQFNRLKKIKAAEEAKKHPYMKKDKNGK